VVVEGVCLPSLAFAVSFEGDENMRINFSITRLMMAVAFLAVALAIARPFGNPVVA